MAASYKLLAASMVNLVLLLMKSLCLNSISRKGAKNTNNQKRETRN
jgi:hypothetical protein